MSSLRAGKLGDRGSILGRDNRFFLFFKAPRPSLVPKASFSMGTVDAFPTVMWNELKLTTQI